MQNLNVVAITGNLCADPELKQAGETTIARLRIAVNGRKKQGGEWVDVAHYVNVTAFGRQAENIGKYLTKGRPVAVEGRLDFQEWEKDGQKRSALSVVANNVQFLSTPEGQSQSGGGQSQANDDLDMPF